MKSHWKAILHGLFTMAGVGVGLLAPHVPWLNWTIGAFFVFVFNWLASYTIPTTDGASAMQ